MSCANKERCPSRSFAPQVLETLVERKDLTAGETKATLTAMLNDFDTAQVAAFLALLRAKVGPLDRSE